MVNLYDLLITWLWKSVSNTRYGNGWMSTAFVTRFAPARSAFTNNISIRSLSAFAGLLQSWRSVLSVLPTVR
jgi:hypothetical protein